MVSKRDCIALAGMVSLINYSIRKNGIEKTLQDLAEVDLPINESMLPIADSAYQGTLDMVRLANCTYRRIDNDKELE